MHKLRIWLASRLLGKTPYIKNVTFYQTVCIDISSCVHIVDSEVNLGHDIKWKGENDRVGFNFYRYSESIKERI